MPKTIKLEPHLGSEELENRLATRQFEKWFGLLGLLSIFGLLILVLLPGKHKDAV